MSVNIPAGIGSLKAISCPSATECVAGGQTPDGTSGIAVETTDGGFTWSANLLPSGAPPVNDVSCASTADCVVNAVLQSSSSAYLYWQHTIGGSFSEDTVPSGVGYAQAMTCVPGSSDCFAAATAASCGYAVGDVIASADGGQTWTVAPSSASLVSSLCYQGAPEGGFTGISCVDTVNCVATGWSNNGPVVSTTTDGWQHASIAQGFGGYQANLASVSCSSTSWCMAGGQLDFFYGNPWSLDSWTEGSGGSGPNHNYLGGNELGTVCVLPETCAFVGTLPGGGTSTGAIVTYDGAANHWATDSMPSGVASVNGVACSPQNICFAVGVGTGGSGVLLADNGDALTAPTATVQGSAVGPDQYGGGDPSSPSAGCGCGAGTEGVNPATAEPVNPATGDFYTSTTDISVPGAGPPLQFRRTYDALLAQSETAAGAPEPPLGYGWSSNLGMSLSYDAGQGVATIDEENGAQVTFTNSSSEPWCANLATNFCASAPRIEATLEHNADGSWTFMRYVGETTTFQFSSAGAVSSMSDAQGTLTAAAYSACPPGDSCSEWTASSSRALVIEEDSSGQIVAVFNPNGTSYEATFAYAGSSCASELCGAVDPGGISYAYVYSDSTGNGPEYANDMVAVQPLATSRAISPSAISSFCGPPVGAAPEGYVVNCYNASGQVVAQALASGEVTEFAYAGDPAALSGGSTGVTQYPEGTSGPASETDYFYSSGVLTQLVSGAGVSQKTEIVKRDPASLLPAVSYDSLSEPTTNTYQDANSPSGTPAYSDLTTSLDPLGNTSQYAYNALNEPWCVVEPAEYANAVRCPTSEPSLPAAGSGRSTNDVGVSFKYYDVAGNEIASTNADGFTSSTAYTTTSDGVPAGLAYCSVDAAAYSVAGVGCPSYGSTALGASTTTYDSAGDVLTTTNALGATTRDSYGDASFPWLPTTVTDPNGQITTNTYDSAGRLVREVVSYRAYSATNVYAYDSAGRIYCTISPLSYSEGHTSCVTPAPASPPVAGSDRWAGQSITIYDPENRPVYTLNALGGVTATAYDEAGEAFCGVGAYEYAKGITCPSSPPSSPPSPGNDPYLGATITSYDAGGRVVQVTNPLGGITLTNYDAAGNVAATTVESNNATADPNLVTSYSYNTANELVQKTVGAGSASATSLSYYDPNGELYCSVSPRAYSAGSAQCPASWQPSWISTPPSPSSLYSSSPGPGQAEGVTTSFYDADGNEVQTTSPTIATTVSAVDADGRTYCGADPVNVSGYLSSNPQATWPYLCPPSPPTSPPATGSDPGYSTTIFDPAGDMTFSSDQLGDTTSYSYDSSGNRLTMTDPRGEVTSYCYYYESATGKCAAGAPAGGGGAEGLYSMTTPVTAVDPSGETTTYSYLPGGSTGTTTTPAGTTTDSYDANGDLARQSYSNTATGYSAPTNVSSSYYQDGARETLADETGTTSYAYDAMGDQISASLLPAAGYSAESLGHAYYATGLLQAVTYPSYSGHANPSATYSYDSLGNMASVTDWLGNEVALGHDGDGNLTSQNNAVSGTNPNGTSSTNFAYNLSDELTSATSTLAQTCSGQADSLIQSFSGTSGSLNADGQVTHDLASYTNSCSSQGSYNRYYSYDLAGRVTYQGSVAQGSSSPNFSYNPASELTQISSHDAQGSFNTYSESPDAAGETTSQQPQSGSGGSTSTYGYDTIGDLTSSVTGGVTSAYSYDQLGRLTQFQTVPNRSNYTYTGDGLQASVNYPLAHWSTGSNIDQSQVIYLASCVPNASSTFCAIVDGGGGAVIYNSSGFSARQAIDGTTQLNGVSCPSTTFCAAVDDTGHALTYNGTSWSSPKDIDGTTGIVGISCPTSRFCAAVDSTGHVLTYNSGSWSSPKDIDDTALFRAISCASSSFCAALDYYGRVLYFNGSSWSAPATFDTKGFPMSISCPTARFCAAVDHGGYVVTYDGTSWSSPQDIDGSNTMSSISCVSSSLCEATDWVGNVFTDLNGNWSSPDNIDGSRHLDTVSCWTTFRCVAADDAGYGFLSGQTRVVDQFAWDSSTALPEVMSDGTNYYLYGPSGQPVEEVNVSPSSPASNPTFLTYTASDSSWLATNAAGEEISFWGYDAFGNLAFGLPASPFGFAGQYEDASSFPSGLANMRARWYDPQTGSFTTRDPAFQQTGQAYGYAGGDPVNGSDPSGLCVSLFNVVCVGGGSVTSTVSLRFNPGAGLNWFNENVNPAYMALTGYYNEIQATENGCGLGTELGYGAEGVIGVAGSLGIAAGGAGAVGGLFGGAAEGGSAAATTSAEILQDPQALEGLTPSQVDDLAGNAGYDILPGKAGAANPATRYYVPGTNGSVGFRVLPSGVAGQAGIKGGAYLRFFGGPFAGLRIPLASP